MRWLLKIIDWVILRLERWERNIINSVEEMVGHDKAA